MRTNDLKVVLIGTNWIRLKPIIILYYKSNFLKLEMAQTQKQI